MTIFSKTVVLLFLAMLPLSHVALAGNARSMVKSIVLSKVDMKNISVGEVVQFLRTESKRLDPDHKGVNFMFKRGIAPRTDFRKRKVTLSFNQLTLEDVIRYLCMAAGLRYQIEESAVIITASDIPIKKMQTRSYPIRPGVLDSKLTRKARTLQLSEDDDK